jgi:hypothetical protein
MIPRNRYAVIAVLAVLAVVLGACSESTTPDGADTDTTAPVVVGTAPAANAIQVATNAAIQVTFNEDMAPASAVGQVTLSSGGTPTITWQSARILNVSHGTAWAGGIPVTVNVGTGLTDVAGNALATAYTFSFFTATSAFLLTATEPLDTATAVNRSASVRLQFSQTPNLFSVRDYVTITDANVKTVHQFTVSDGGGNNWVVLDPVSDLPAATLITVTIGANVYVEGSPLNILGGVSSFDFTTGVAVDTTPPTIVSLSPANGTTNVAANIGVLTITFSEPIVPATFSPTALNLEFQLVMEGGADPVWSQGNTVMTVALPTLPAGLEMEVTFANYTDGSGNSQSTPTVWSVQVAGTADIFPMTDGIRHNMYGRWSRGLAGSSHATDFGTSEEYRLLEIQPNGDVRAVVYDDTMLTAPRRWDTYDRAASVINWLGFADGNDSTLQEITFDTPVKFLPLPMVIGNWSGSTTVTVPGEGSYQAVTTGRVIAREDLPVDAPGSEADLYYKDAWKVARSMVVSLNGTWFTTMTDTTWYSPTVGPVREISHSSSAANGAYPAGWDHTELWRDPSVGR